MTSDEFDAWWEENGWTPISSDAAAKLLAWEVWQAARGES